MEAIKAPEELDNPTGADRLEMWQVKFPCIALIAALLFILLSLAPLKRPIYVSPAGTEVTPTSVQSTQPGSDGSETASPQSTPSK